MRIYLNLFPQQSMLLGAVTGLALATTPWQLAAQHGSGLKLGITVLALADRSAAWVDLLEGFPIPTPYHESYPEGTPGEHLGRLQSEQALLHARAITEVIRAALASCC